MLAYPTSPSKSTSTQPSYWFKTSNSSPSGINASLVQSVFISARTFKVCVVTVAMVFITSWAFATAASPVMIYSAFTYPVTWPDSILSHSPSSSNISHPASFCIFPTISELVSGCSLTFKLLSTCAIPRLVYPQIVVSAGTAVSVAAVSASTVVSVAAASSDCPSIVVTVLVAETTISVL